MVSTPAISPWAGRTTHLEHVSLRQVKSPGRDVDAFPSLHLDAVDALVVVLVVHGVVRREEDAFIVHHGRAALS